MRMVRDLRLRMIGVWIVAFVVALLCVMLIPKFRTDGQIGDEQIPEAIHSVAVFWMAILACFVSSHICRRNSFEDNLLQIDVRRALFYEIVHIVYLLIILYQLFDTCYLYKWLNEEYLTVPSFQERIDGIVRLALMLSPLPIVTFFWASRMDNEE